MNIIQSFSSKPCDEFKLFVQTCYFSLSCLYAKESDISIKLYTDSVFAECVKGLPYKDVIISLDNLPNLNLNLWAYPKFVALDSEPAGTIHIDGDVFLKKKSLLKTLDFANYDCITQHLEHYNDNVVYRDSFNSVSHLDFPEFIDKTCPTVMPNNGILGFNSKSLWETYRDIYWQMANKYNESPKVLGTWVVPDIIFEQYFLLKVCENFGYKIKYMLCGNTPQEISDNAAQIGYQHCCADKNNSIEKCLNLIRRKSVSTYNKIKDDWINKFPKYF